MTGSMEELKNTELAAGDDISATDVANITPEEWGKEIENRAYAKAVFRNYVLVNTDLVGRSGDTIKLPKRPVVDTDTYGATDIANDTTEVTPNLELEWDTVDLVPTEVGIAANITKNAVENALLSVIDHTIDNMAVMTAIKEDKDIVSAVTLADDADPIKYVEADADGAPYVSGDWTTTVKSADQTNVTPTDVLDLGVITEANDVLMAMNGFEGDTVFIHPRQKAALMRNSNFLDASQAGDNQMLRKGVIGQIFGLDVVVSKHVPTITISDGNAGTQTGYQAILIDSTAACGLAVKRKPTVETEYSATKRKHTAVSTSLYQAKRLNSGAVVVINTA